MTFPKDTEKSTKLPKSIVISPPPGTRALSSTSDIPQHNDIVNQQHFQQQIEIDYNVDPDVPQNNRQHLEINEAHYKSTNGKNLQSNEGLASTEQLQAPNTNCDAINTNFPSSKSIILNYVARSDSPLECGLCFAWFVGNSRVKSLEQHLISSHGIDAITWRCPLCLKYEHKETRSIGTHVRSCSKKFPARYRELSSNSSPSAASKDFRSVSVGRFAYCGIDEDFVSCDVCGLKIYGLGLCKAMVDHLKKDHKSSVVEIKCGLCDNRYTDVVSARSHVNQCRKKDALNKMNINAEKITSKNASSRDATSEDTTSKGITSEATTSKDSTSKDSTSKDSTSKDTTSVLPRTAEGTIKGDDAGCISRIILESESSCGSVQAFNAENYNPSSLLFNDYGSGVGDVSFHSGNVATSQSYPPHDIKVCTALQQTSFAEEEVECQSASTFTVSACYEFVLNVLEERALHPRYQNFLRGLAAELRDHPEPVTQELMDSIAGKYEAYLRCGRTLMTNHSRSTKAKNMGLRIVKLKVGPQMVLNAIAFHVFDNPAQAHIVLRRILDNIGQNTEYYSAIMTRVDDANVSLQCIVDNLKKGRILSPIFCMWAAASTFNCDFQILTPYATKMNVIRSRTVASKSFNIWMEDSKQFPCVRCRFLNISQRRAMNKKRNRALYFANTTQLAKETFENVSLNSCKIPAKMITDHFAGLFQSIDTCKQSEVNRNNELAKSNWKWIDAEEIKTAQRNIKTSSALGPDKISCRQVMAFDPHVVGLVLIYNMAMEVGGPPKAWKENRTILIPKNGADEKALKCVNGWRPITISSVLMRIMHRILLARLRQEIDLDVSQTCFDVEACHSNLLTIRALLRQSRAVKRSIAMAILDVKSAFDTISHDSLRNALCRTIKDAATKEYILNAFSSSHTKIYTSTGPPSEPIHFNRGVKQGDPLSPFLFALCIDEVLRKVRESRAGYVEGATYIPAIVYADDILLIGNDQEELQSMINVVSEELKHKGLLLSPKKCRTYIQNYQRGKLSEEVTASVKLEGTLLECITEGDTIQYLGGTPWAKCSKESICQMIDELAFRTKQAQLNPTQAVHLLNDYGIPRVIAQLQNAHDLSTTCLSQIDQYWRKTIKKILFLPAYINNGAFHLPLNQGGMGFRGIEHEVLSSRKKAHSTVTGKYPELNHHIKGGENISTYESSAERGANLKKAWEGAATQSLGAQHFWDGNFDRRLISFRYRQSRHKEYVENVKMRYQLLEVGTVLSKLDKNRTRKCRHCCAADESCLHVLNECNYITRAMISRHDAVQKRLVWAIKRRNPAFEVMTENRIHDPGGNLHKPDLIIVDRENGRITIADIAIYYETNINRGEEITKQKEEKYLPICDVVAAQYNVEERNVETLGIAVGSRGSFSKTLLKRLRSLNLNTGCAINMCRTAAEKSLQVYHTFMGRKQTK